MLEYPKIETLYNRDEATHCLPKHGYERVRRQQEFALPNRWLITEKIDGTNIRVSFSTKVDASVAGDSSFVGFGGRTDAAQVPPFLLAHLQETFTREKLVACFDPDTQGILFGEGYGARIQKAGGNYRPDASFRLFDVVVLSEDGRVWWLDWHNVEDVARKLGIETVPVIFHAATLADAVWVVEGENFHSRVSLVENNGLVTNAEGVVARTDPLLFDRRGHRLMWKLKGRDFGGKP